MDTTAYALIDFLLHVITPSPKRRSNCYNSKNEVQAYLAAIGCNGQEILRAHLAAIGCNGLTSQQFLSLPLKAQVEILKFSDRNSTFGIF